MAVAEAFGLGRPAGELMPVSFRSSQTWRLVTAEGTALVKHVAAEEWLDDFAERAQPLGPVCDLGCGPGHIGRYLQEHGARAVGLDLSFGNLQQARQLNPRLEVVQGDMMALPFKGESLGGIAAFYSIIHLDRSEVPAAVREMRRVLRSGGWLLLAFHLGNEILHEEQLWGYAVDFDATLFTLPEVVQQLNEAGLVVEKAEERDPYSPEVEYQSRRGYILAHRA